MLPITKPVPGQRPLFVSNFSGSKTDSTSKEEEKEQIKIDVIAKTSTSKNDGSNLPNDILLEIMRQLNPPNRKNFEKSFRDIPDLSHELCHYTSKNGVFWHQFGVSPPINLPPNFTLRKVWFTAFNEMPQPMQTMYTDANLFFDVFDAFHPKETDYMHQAAVAVSKACKWASESQWTRAKEGITTAEGHATTAGETLPVSAYENVINACVDRAVVSVSSADWTCAKEGSTAAEYFATKTGKTLRVSAYEKLMNACLDKAVVLARYGQSNRTKEDITMAEYFATKAGTTLPVSAYEKAMNACVDRAVVGATYCDWTLVTERITAAEYFATKTGKTLPVGVYEKLMNACVDAVVVLPNCAQQAYKYLLCSKEGITVAEDFATKAGKTLPVSTYEQAINVCISRAVRLARFKRFFYADIGISTADYFAKKISKPLPEQGLELAAKLRSMGF